MNILLCVEEPTENFTDLINYHIFVWNARNIQTHWQLSLQSLCVHPPHPNRLRSLLLLRRLLHPPHFFIGSCSVYFLFVQKLYFSSSIFFHFTVLCSCLNRQGRRLWDFPWWVLCRQIFSGHSHGRRGRDEVFAAPVFLPGHPIPNYSCLSWTDSIGRSFRMHKEILAVLHYGYDYSGCLLCVTVQEHNFLSEAKGKASVQRNRILCFLGDGRNFFKVICRLASDDTLSPWNTDTTLRSSSVLPKDSALLTAREHFLCSQRTNNLTGLVLTDDLFIDTVCRVLYYVRMFQM